MNDSIINKLTKFSEEFQQAEKQIDSSMDFWWESLTKEEQMNAFYCVVKRLVKGELVDKGSYRYVLYKTFGFGPESYSLGMMCGFMSLHNAIEAEVESFT
jgi:hypothetical protein